MSLTDTTTGKRETGIVFMLSNQSNSQNALLLSGAVHSFRSTPKLWPQLMRQSRDAGLNAIEAITFWGEHEARRGQSALGNRKFAGRL